MFFYNDKYSKNILTSAGIDAKRAFAGEFHQDDAFKIVAKIDTGKEDSFAVAKWLYQILNVEKIGFNLSFDNRFIHISEYGIFPSSENWHLYNSLRRASCNYDPLWETPCHVFNAAEVAEFITFLDISIRFGWGGLIFGGGDSSTVFFSHDGWVRIGMRDSSESLTNLLQKSGTSLTWEVS